MNGTPPTGNTPQEDCISPEALRTIFTHTHGMLLSQVSDLCRLEGTTIQNWVKRGLVPPAEHKRYDLRTVARILIVDLLRDCLSLEHISFLLGCINGKVVDPSDDVLGEPELYQYLFNLTREIDSMNINDPEDILALTRRRGPNFEDVEIQSRVETSLQAMLLAHCSVKTKRQAEARIAMLLRQYPQVKEHGSACLSNTPTRATDNASSSS